MHLENSQAPAPAEPRTSFPVRKKRLRIRDLLKPHIGALIIGLLAVAGEGAANLLQPWPLKIVLDDALRSHESHPAVTRWMHPLIGLDKLAMLRFACLAVLAIAALDAIASYLEKYLTTSVGQWISYDLRRRVYSHIQKLSLAFHDQERSGDIISRVTSDIDAIQSFITQGLSRDFDQSDHLGGHGRRDVLSGLAIYPGCAFCRPRSVCRCV